MINKLNNIGTYHISLGSENEDVIHYKENDQFRVISLADGVSTCDRAKTGAEIASRTITDLLLNEADYFLEYEPENMADLIISQVVHELGYAAKESSAKLNDYSSTLSSVVLDKKRKKILLFHLGDGIIIATGGNRCAVLAKPFDSSVGCCVTTTEEVADMVEIKMIDIRGLKTIILCSDGAWHLMYDRGKLKQEAAKYFIENDFDNLKAFMEQQGSFDDYSFISMNVQ